MSTLFLIGMHEIEKSETIARNEDLFDRIVELQDLDSLMVNLYRDRVSPFPNAHNFETGVSLVLYDPSKPVSYTHLDVYKRQTTFKPLSLTHQRLLIPIRSLPNTKR